MKSNDVNKQFSDALFEHEISAGFSVSYKIRNGIQAKTAKAASAFGIGQDIIECYRSMGGLNYTWEQSKIAQDDLIGKINILQLEEVIASWQGNIYFADEPKESDLRLFHPIDEFSEEAHCGILLNKNSPQRLYFHYYGDDELLDLALDFSAYLELALAARGFFYWQTYLLELLYGIESAESERFKQFMPVLFEDFNLDEFKQRFNALKLN